MPRSRAMRNSAVRKRGVSSACASDVSAPRPSRASASRLPKSWNIESMYSSYISAAPRKICPAMAGSRAISAMYRSHESTMRRPAAVRVGAFRALRASPSLPLLGRALPLPPVSTSSPSSTMARRSASSELFAAAPAGLPPTTELLRLPSPPTSVASPGEAGTGPGAPSSSPSLSALVKSCTGPAATKASKSFCFDRSATLVWAAFADK
mmetsp:Transcript_9101/g.37250  ORF Transcript_9101/g.37250 Transcript_9101/m.37250 type:complete len:209 (-) Transcript_9101:1736-2362(-)